MIFPRIDTSTWFYKNCRRQRKNGAKICQCCPFRRGIEDQESGTAQPEDSPDDIQEQRDYDADCDQYNRVGWSPTHG